MGIEDWSLEEGFYEWLDFNILGKKIYLFSVKIEDSKRSFMGNVSIYVVEGKGVSIVRTVKGRL